jgi:hypothetical protein
MHLATGFELDGTFFVAMVVDVFVFEDRAFGGTFSFAVREVGLIAAAAATEAARPLEGSLFSRGVEMDAEEAKARALPFEGSIVDPSSLRASTSESARPEFGSIVVCSLVSAVVVMAAVAAAAMRLSTVLAVMKTRVVASGSAKLTVFLLAPFLLSARGKFVTGGDGHGGR